LKDEPVDIQIHFPSSSPTLIYLPGLHGDWTLIGGFREALNGRARFVELTYPRTLSWSLHDYAEGVEEALTRNQITSGWLLGESFGSQVIWPMLERKKFKVEGVVLAGGFVRHPTTAGVRFAEWLVGSVSLALVTRILFGYARIARLRFRRSPETVNRVNEFIARRTRLDQQAAQHRLHLLARADFCNIAQAASLPIYAITGLLDPVVPWPLVRSWMKRNCPALRGYRIISGADHNVLSTSPYKSSDQIIDWINPRPTTEHL
jgi:pimeloyl-ACP methyl ester carboxylesterase